MTEAFLAGIMQHMEAAQARVFDMQQVRVFAISPHSDVVHGAETLRHVLRELFESNSEFLHNVTQLLDCFGTGRLFGLLLPETEAMFMHQGHDALFMESRAPWTLPAFCCLDASGAVDLLWVHPRARRLGLGSALLWQLNVSRASGVLRDSLGFWDRHPQVAYPCVRDAPVRCWGDLDAGTKCNHWGLVGFPGMARAHAGAAEAMLQPGMEPWHWCAACTDRNADKKRPASSRGACGGAPGSARTGRGGACARTRGSCRLPCTARSRARCSGSQRAGARSPGRAS
jgi:GNAT superfamily N-acetyltransferase